ncbi:DUF928 domain-containing protein [Argonema antarcticum]|uniref:DUF928 domain-containing protein n=1 Tax=Argonema antarcticum TaxID=2942763 RepID=UPI002011137F|nr:DUF928 domain-containing protein [Argonema antarcticum]MCL1471533.1 DUF928 domain-containing protein [Argonema antarcticum A004/B2]
MPRILLYKAIAAIGLTSTLTFGSYCWPNHVLAQDSSQERMGIPGRRVGGGTRGPEQGFSEKPLVALAPENNQSLTVAENPTFFFYVPKTQTPQMVEFVLNDEKGETIDQTTFVTNGDSGVIGVSLSANSKIKSLEIGKTYRWYFAIIPPSGNREADISVDGSIQRVNTPDTIASQLKNANPLDRAALYAGNNFWSDAIATVAELRRDRPNDAAVAAKWAELLKTLKLDNIVQEPVVEYRVSKQ